MKATFIPRAQSPRTPIGIYTEVLTKSTAGVLAVMATAQLMTYDAFSPIFQNYQLPGGTTTGIVLAAVLVLSEVFSLPFLLRMNLSPLFRYLSAVCAIATSIIWGGIAIWVLFGYAPLALSSGVLGGIFDHVFTAGSVVITGAVTAILLLVCVWTLSKDLRL